MTGLHGRRLILVYGFFKPKQQVQMKICLSSLEIANNIPNSIKYHVIGLCHLRNENKREPISQLLRHLLHE